MTTHPTDDELRDALVLDKKANALFIAAARTGWPAAAKALLDTREALRVILAACKANGLHIHAGDCPGAALSTIQQQDESCTCWWNAARTVLGERL